MASPVIFLGMPQRYETELEPSIFAPQQCFFPTQLVEHQLDVLQNSFFVANAASMKVRLLDKFNFGNLIKCNSLMLTSSAPPFSSYWLILPDIGLSLWDDVAYNFSLSQGKIYEKGINRRVTQFGQCPCLTVLKSMGKVPSGSPLGVVCKADRSNWKHKPATYLLGKSSYQY